MDAELVDDCTMDLETEDEDEDEEIVDVEKAAEQGLRNGSFNIIGTEENSFRCPFCPGKRKQAYDYASLLAHAAGQGRGAGGKAVEFAARHRMLARHLTQDLALRPAQPEARPSVLLQQEPPPRAVESKAMVYPWAALLLNVKSVEAADGRRSGPGIGELKRQFGHFRPVRVDVGYDASTGYQGWALLRFGATDAGYKNAKAFDRSFLELNRGRKQWMSKSAADGLGTDLYGWMATEEDTSPETAFGTFLLSKKFDLKTHDDYWQQRRRMEEQKYRHLSIRFHEQAEEMEKIRTEADLAMSRLKQQHHEELEEYVAAAHSKRLVHQEVVQKRAVQLDEELAALTNRCNQLSLKENEDGTQREVHDMEKHENKLKMKVIAGEAEIRQKFSKEQLALLEKHESQTRQLEETLQAYKIKLHQKQLREMELLQLLERLETAEVNQDGQQDDTTQKLKEDIWELREEDRAANYDVHHAGEATEELVTHDDEHLVRLRTQVGDEVAQSLCQALNQLRNCTPYGRHPAREKMAQICGVLLDCVKVQAEAKQHLQNELQEALAMSGVTPPDGQGGWGKRVRA